MKLKLINTNLLTTYLEKVCGVEQKFNALCEADISTESFSFYSSVASVFSSKIEGEIIELDSYIKHKAMGVAFQPDYTKKTDDLYDAYQFAKNNSLTPFNIAQAHHLLAKNLVQSHQLGEFRNNIMYVVTDDGKIEYVAASPYMLTDEMDKWYADLASLLSSDLSINEVFYYASMLHLSFVKIHPWNDGNGRSARLIEKWFIASKLGEKAWFLQSEKYYYQHHTLYYTHLRALGLEYDELDYNRSLPFLLLLPSCLTN